MVILMRLNELCGTKVEKTHVRGGTTSPRALYCRQVPPRISWVGGLSLVVETFFVVEQVSHTRRVDDYPARLIFTWPRRNRCTNTRQSLLNNILISVWYCVYYTCAHVSELSLSLLLLLSSSSFIVLFNYERRTFFYGIVYFSAAAVVYIVCARRSCGYNSLKNNLRNAFFSQFSYTYTYTYLQQPRLKSVIYLKLCYYSHEKNVH